MCLDKSYDVLITHQKKIHKGMTASQAKCSYSQNNHTERQKVISKSELRVECPQCGGIEDW